MLSGFVRSTTTSVQLHLCVFAGLLRETCLDLILRGRAEHETARSGVHHFCHQQRGYAQALQVDFFFAVSLVGCYKVAESDKCGDFIEEIMRKHARNMLLHAVAELHSNTIDFLPSLPAFSRLDAVVAVINNAVDCDFNHSEFKIGNLCHSRTDFDTPSLSFRAVQIADAPPTVFRFGM